MKDININLQPAGSTITSPAKPRFLRTCGNCGFNAYSPGQYSEHMAQKHGKTVAKSVLSEPRKVSNSMKKATLDVPEEILVKPKNVAKPKDEVAKSRLGRQPAKEPATASQTTQKEQQAEKPKRKPRKRRTKAQMEADKAKE